MTMRNERDFTSCEQKKHKSYLGANGSKRCLVIDGEDYMVKFPAVPTKQTELSYINSCISEYIGCHIFEIADIPVQETMLGTFTTESGKTKIVVACKDVTKPGVELIPFAGLKNQIVDSPRNGYGTELSEILETFDKQESFSADELKERFWDMFIVDALIGNWDRHNGNWGYLYDSINNTVSLAPVYDCGSSLFPQADTVMIKNILKDPNEIKHRVYSIPLSSIKINDKKINYRDFINSLENEDCNKSLKKIFPKLSMNRIISVLDETPYISDLQKQFYKTILEARHELILAPAYKRIIEQEKKSFSVETIPFDECKKFGEEYVKAILSTADTESLSLKESTSKVHRELVNNDNRKRIMLNIYLNNGLGIHDNKEFASYISNLKEMSKKISKEKMQKISSKNIHSSDDIFGIS